MALTPTFRIDRVVTGNNAAITLVDETVYGPGGVGNDPSRAEVTVDFEVVHKLNAGNNTIGLGTYDPATVVSLGPVNIVRGFFIVKMTITPINGDPVSEVTNNYLFHVGVATATLINGVITITDTSVYGVGEPALRNDVEVTFGLVLKNSSGDIVASLPTLDPLTAIQAQGTDLADGHYEASITYTPAGGGLGATTLNFQLVKTTDLESCLESAQDAWMAKSCNGDEGDTLFWKYLKIKETEAAVNQLTVENNYTTAQCLIEGIQALCTDENCQGC